MTRRQFQVLMLLTVISAVVGGGVSGWLFSGLPVTADQSTDAPEVIQAQEFRVVDVEGNTRARLGYVKEDGMASLLLWDSAGKVRAFVGNVTTVTYDEVGLRTTSVNPAFHLIPEKDDTLQAPLP